MKFSEFRSTGPLVMASSVKMNDEIRKLKFNEKEDG